MKQKEENYRMNRAGKVFVQNVYAGSIMETDSGYEFSYDSTYLENKDAMSVSLTLPLRQEAFTSNTLFPFFDGLIPEGWLLNVVKRNWKIDGKDRFGLMLLTCKDCIGDVRIEAS